MIENQNSIIHIQAAAHGFQFLKISSTQQLSQPLNPICSPFIFVLQCEPHSFSLMTKPPQRFVFFLHTGH